MAYFSTVKIKNFVGNTINPSTEEKQDDIIAAIGNVPSTLATEFTLNEIFYVVLDSYNALVNTLIPNVSTSGNQVSTNSYILDLINKVDTLISGIKILDTNGNVANPSTYDNQLAEISILQSIAGFNIPKYDDVQASVIAETETINFYFLTVLVATLVVTYSDSTLVYITEIKRTL